MPVKPESALYKRIKENLLNCRITRLESRVGLGIPDCLIAFPGKWVMLELKVVRRGRKVNLSPHQIAFHLVHGEMRVPTFILVQYFPPGVTQGAKSELLLFRGDQAEELHHLGVDAEPHDSWSLTGPVWHMLRLKLIGG
jgi:hypothetical protein